MCSIQLYAINCEHKELSKRAIPFSFDRGAECNYTKWQECIRKIVHNNYYARFGSGSAYLEGDIGRSRTAGLTLKISQKSKNILKISQKLKNPLKIHQKAAKIKKYGTNE